VRVISRKRLVEAIESDRTLEGPLKAWYKVVSKADWKSIADVRQTYSSADYVDPFTVFNIRGNQYRLIVKIEYKKHLVFINHLLTHREYDKGRWKI
jgi:mRNA interferase HigB